jgi:transposase InsO family protein
MREIFVSVGVGRLCKLFGKTRHAFYDKNWYLNQRYSDEKIMLELLLQIRREIPVLSTKVIYQMIRPTLRNHGITVGRDALHELRRDHGMLYRRKRRYVTTTDSHHRFYKYPNRIKDIEVTRIEQIWVSDITYIRLLDGFSFLSLVTDMYSHKVVGYCLYPTLEAQGPLVALRMAIASLTKPSEGLIHHSDRGIQYCCDEYTQELQLYLIDISMTDNGDPYENAMAERLNGILKKNFGLGKVFNGLEEAQTAVNRAIDAYNNLRPHQSISMLTPSTAHQPEYEGQLKRTWKSRSKMKGHLDAKTV